MRWRRTLPGLEPNAVASTDSWKTGRCWHKASEQEEGAGDTTGATLPLHQMGENIFTMSSLPNSSQQVPILLSSTAESWLCKERGVKGLPPCPSALCGAGPKGEGMEEGGAGPPDRSHHL